MNLNFDMLSTAIGSFPHTDPIACCQYIFKSFPEIPLWPQLSSLGLRENMYIQFSEGLPFVKIDEGKKRMFFQIPNDTTTGLERFYERVLEEDLENFATSNNYSNGLYAFLNLIEKDKAYISSAKYLKGQIIGPISFGLTVTDQNNKSIFYIDEMRDVIVKGLVMKAKWQIRELKNYFPQVILFVDEPYLVSLGSAFVSLEKQEVIQYLNEVICGIHDEGAIAGIHCCGNTDWSVLMETDVDILSFDTYGYLDTLSLYTKELTRFLERGSVLAWGIVPTSDKAFQEDDRSLADRLAKGIKILVQKGLDEEKLLGTSLITPSCGTGTLPVELAERIIELTKGVSSLLKSP